MSKTTINDMTIGSPAKLIIKFMIPMCLGNLFQQFYNVVDSIVAGQFLEEYRHWPQLEVPVL